MQTKRHVTSGEVRAKPPNPAFKRSCAKKPRSPLNSTLGVMTSAFAIVRDWIQLLFIVIGGSIALAAFIQNIRQRRVENALKLVQRFYDRLQPGDLEHFKSLVRSYSPDGPPTFDEGPENDFALSRMILGLEVLCFEANRRTADARIIYFETGQLLRWCRDWMTDLPDGSSAALRLTRDYPNIARFFHTYSDAARSWPCHVHAFPFAERPLAPDTESAAPTDQQQSQRVSEQGVRGAHDA